MGRQDGIERIDRIRAEALVAMGANELLEATLRDDPSFGTARGWRVRDVRRWRANLEGTFLIRMQAEFESELRDAWAGAFRQASRPRMRDLLLAISARLSIHPAWHDRADEVRLARNALLHDGGREAPAVSVAEARSRLVRYLSRLPPDW